jgi:hypothetical protein
MKKIIALILALVCVFALVACAPASNDLAAYTSAIANTTPTTVIVDVTSNDTEFAISLNAKYTIVYNEDGSASVDYVYDVLNPATTADNMKTTKTGSATVSADGTVTGDGVNMSVLAAADLSLNLNAPIKSYIVARGILTANIEKANTAAVLGVELPSDASLELRMADAEGTKIGQATINYSDERGTIRIVCQYD